MSALITTSLSQSNFETVRDKIGAILKLELDNQALLKGTPAVVGSPPVAAIPNPLYVYDIYVERLTAIDITEENVIVVGIVDMSLENDTRITQRNTVSYSIDIYHNTNEEDTTATNKAKYELDLIVGVVRKIIQSPFYEKLGLTNGIVQHRTIQRVLYSDREDKQSAKEFRMARIILSVAMTEETVQGTPTTATSYSTTVKLESTTKGYKFIYTNP